MVHVLLMFLWECREIPTAPCPARKKKLMPVFEMARVSWKLLSASLTRRVLPFGTWTDLSFQRHYRFRPTSKGSNRAKELSAPPRISKLHAGRKKIYLPTLTVKTIKRFYQSMQHFHQVRNQVVNYYVIERERKEKKTNVRISKIDK